jgi:hypothetical protein
MTTRCGDWAQTTLRKTRSKKLSDLVLVVRTDGVKKAYTNLDRDFLFEGVTYESIVFAGLSAERRETALKGGNQEIHGIIDSRYILLPDLHGDRYNGAEVWHTVVDWGLPLLWYARHFKIIRKVSFSELAFVGIMETRAQVLTRPSGGRFKGKFTVTCTKSIGDADCKKNITVVPYTQKGVRVDSVVVDRMEFTTRSSTWQQMHDDNAESDADSGTFTSPTSSTNMQDTAKTWFGNEHVGRFLKVGSALRRIVSNTTDTVVTLPFASGFSSGVAYKIVTLVDNYFRDGEFEWRWSVPVVASQCTLTTASSALTDTTKTWTVDEHVGREVRILNGDDGAVIEHATITSNTAHALFFEGLQSYPSGTYYDICGLCANAGVINNVIQFKESNRSVVLLTPTPFPIIAGDSGIIRVGCDGLKVTCNEKFHNLENFSGDSESPTAGKILQPPKEDA